VRRTGSGAGVPRGRGRRDGFSLLEVMISSTVFLIVAGAVVTTLVVSNALNMTGRETALASRGAQSILEELKATPFEEVFARYNVIPDDDPGGTSPGANFAVTGLTPGSDDADGFVGAIEFPGGGQELHEDGEDAELGLPRDLDGDGAVDDQDHAADYRILPVRVVISWNGQNGARTFELVTVLTELR
jgi:prepilin-type N-terminal cleavage/methylation domain-containing protein